MSEFIKNDVQPPKKNELESWITTQLETYGEFLLAFANDGVIWGKLNNSELVRSPGAPELDEKTLQQAFMFGKDDEIRLFQNETGDWQALHVVDSNDPKRVIKESQVLWGNQSKGQPENGFVYAEEYRAGIPGQWLPLDETFGPDKCARLEVHHLVEFDDDTGEAYIILSRLAGLSVDDRAKEM